MGSVAIVHGREGPADAGALGPMLGAAPHRGEPVATIVLGRTALAASADRDLPNASMSERDGLAAAVAGTLDNEGDLRRELAADGRPPGDGSAAVVAEAFRRWGTDAPSHFRGSIAGAVTDGVILHVFRDHFGCRPLFRHQARDAFYAATEVKQVTAGAGLSREPDLDYLDGLVYGGVTTSTAIRGVERVPRGTVGTVAPGSRPVFRRYWDPEGLVETVRCTPDEAREGVVEALERAVRRTLRGHDAILLSGGLDSPSLAAFAAGVTPPVRALTAIYPDHPSVDERPWAEFVAGAFGLPFHTFAPTASSLDDVERWVDRLDGPVDVVSVPEAAEAYRRARSIGARVVLSGEVAERLFECRAYLLDHLLAHGRLRSAVREVRNRRAEGGSWRAVVRDVVSTAVPPSLLVGYGRRIARRRGARGVPAWLDAGRMYRGGTTERPILGSGPHRRWKRVQAAPFSGPGIGFEVDEIVAAHCGVDIRHPFTDVDLWTFVLALRAEVKFPHARTKSLLREAVRGRVPDEIIDRRDKTYFDEYHLAKADYPTLKRFLVNPAHRVAGVDYQMLADRIESGALSITELQWARDLVRVHAFLGLGSGREASPVLAG